MPAIRSFIAIEVPAQVKQRAVEVQNRLQGQTSGIKWVRAENLHLTLKFLGQIPEEWGEQIANLLGEATRGLTSFRLAVTGLGVFPDVRHPRVIWMGLADGGGRLAELRADIEAALYRGLGIPFEQQAFSPHLTLGRVGSPEGRFNIGSLLHGSWRDAPLGEIPVKEVLLMRSQLHPTGAVYTPLCSVELKGVCDR